MKLDSDAANEEGEHAPESDFPNPLPGDWSRSSLGSAANWPRFLQTLSLTISAFAYPAAIFFGEELVLLQNEAWVSAGGFGQQGEAQRGRLSADLFDALSVSLGGGTPKRLRSHQILQTKPSEDYTVLLSPLFDDVKNDDDAIGVLAQLVPRSDVDKSSNGLTHSRSASVSNAGNALDHQEIDQSEYDDVVDKWPIDEHPFFRRFAEMLPTGLAILDHEARAIFVNQHFYEVRVRMIPYLYLSKPDADLYTGLSSRRTTKRISRSSHGLIAYILKTTSE